MLFFSLVSFVLVSLYFFFSCSNSPRFCLTMAHPRSPVALYLLLFCCCLLLHCCTQALAQTVPCTPVTDGGYSLQSSAKLASFQRDSHALSRIRPIGFCCRARQRCHPNPSHTRYTTDLCLQRDLAAERVHHRLELGLAHQLRAPGCAQYWKQPHHRNASWSSAQTARYHQSCPGDCVRRWYAAASPAPSRGN